MGVVSIAGGAVVGQLVETIAVVTAGATPALDASLASLYTLTPGEDETITATNVTAGSGATLVVTTSGTTSRTLTFGTGFKSTGTLATGTTSAKVFVLKFVGVGTSLVEVSRTTAQ